MKIKDIDLKDLIPCPLCDKLILWKRSEHKCKTILKHTEYVSKELRVKMVWSEDNGWQLYWHPEEVYVDDLRFVDVVNWVNDESVKFQPALSKESEE